MAGGSLAPLTFDEFLRDLGAAVLQAQRTSRTTPGAWDLVITVEGGEIRNLRIAHVMQNIRLPAILPPAAAPSPHSLKRR